MIRHVCTLAVTPPPSQPIKTTVALDGFFQISCKHVCLQRGLLFFTSISSTVTNMDNLHHTVCKAVFAALN